MRPFALFASVATLAVIGCGAAPDAASDPAAPTAAASVSASAVDGPASVQEALQAFPPAAPGQRRTVIALPAEADESLLKVELILGRMSEVDCNRSAYQGQIETRTAEGWGYEYYVLENLGHQVSTQMGCPPESRRQAFVRAGGETLLRYNSRLPVVVYAPEDVEVRYRIWRTGEERTAS